MLQWKSNRAAFTLIELLVVVIIVAVLAAVGVPLLSANIVKARTSEADAGLGTIRTGLRAQFAEFAVYPTIAAGTLATTANVGVQAGDLTGRYFGDSDFTLSSAPATACITATGNTGASTAPRKAQVAGVTRSMSVGGANDGSIFTSNNCTGTAVN